MQQQNLNPPLAANLPETRKLAFRALFLFVNFFLIITAYYQIKPASRSLYIESLGADFLPYVWIGTALILGAAMPVYHRLVLRHSRFAIVVGSCALFAAILVGFRLLLVDPGPILIVSFYIFVDIFGVVLVEQFWSLTNALYTTQEGKRWYGLVGTGGLAGGVAGGVIAATLLNHTPLHTKDLLLTGAALLVVIISLTLLMRRLGLYTEPAQRDTDSSRIDAEQKQALQGWRVILRNRYLMIIAALLLLAQLAQPLVDYQFLKIVEQAYAQTDPRTAFLAQFFSILGLVSIAVNLIITPMVHRLLGVIAGLLVQPLMLAVSSLGFLSFPSLLMASGMKVVDRGLSYSINRASRELLYVPIDSRLIYQAKAWIDMFGYRLFKVVGSVLILLLTQWLPWQLSIVELSFLVLIVCVLWVVTVRVLQPNYQRVTRAREQEVAGVTS